MKTTVGTMLVLLPFLLLLIIFMEGGMFGLFLYVLYMFVASCSAGSFIIGMLLIKHRKSK